MFIFVSLVTWLTFEVLTWGISTFLLRMPFKAKTSTAMLPCHLLVSLDLVADLEVKLQLEYCIPLLGRDCQRGLVEEAKGKSYKSRVNYILG
jgi:hypothetical protein